VPRHGLTHPHACSPSDVHALRHWWPSGQPDTQGASASEVEPQTLSPGKEERWRAICERHEQREQRNKRRRERERRRRALRRAGVTAGPEAMRQDADKENEPPKPKAKVKPKVQGAIHASREQRPALARPALARPAKLAGRPDTPMPRQPRRTPLGDLDLDINSMWPSTAPHRGLTLP
jgi:hypothetical protein